MKRRPPSVPESGLPPLRDGGGRTEEEQLLATLLTLPSRAPPASAVRERVWRQLAKPRRRPRRVPLIAAAALGCALLVLRLALGTPPAGIQVLAASSPVRFSQRSAAQDSANWRDFGVLARLPAAGRFETSPAGRVLLRLPGVATVLLEQGADVSVEPQPRGTLLQLRAGKLTARVTKRPPGAPFVVQTDRARVTVVGTLFSVERGADGETAVSVREGTVEVAPLPAPGPTGASLEPLGVTAGQRWSTAAPAEVSRDRTDEALGRLLERALTGTPGELAADFAALSPSAGPTAAASSPEPALPEPGAAPAAPEPGAAPAAPEPVVMLAPTGPDRPLLTKHLPAAASPARKSRTRPVRSEAVTPDGRANAAEPSSTPERAAPPPDEASTDSMLPTRPPAAQAAPAIAKPELLARLETPPERAPPAAAAPPPPTVPLQLAGEDSYQYGLRLRALDQLAAAAKAFERGALEPRHAELALFALGRLSAHDLHDPDRAREAFHRCRERFPSGVLAQETDFELLGLEVSAGDWVAAEHEADHFLSAHPGSERTDDILSLRGNLLSARGQWALALASYRGVRRPLGEEAAFFRAECLRQTKDAGAAAAFRDYLKRFPQGQHRDAAAAASRVNVE